ncbi:hypothetical protein BJ742DRAFT_890019 [Cladochytrium replicatum]|nr:hypothetical protein BJ742DRAFT_890019 [Cladochytrium replicatum]
MSAITSAFIEAFEHSSIEGIRFSYLDYFLSKQDDAADLTTSEVCERFVVPSTVHTQDSMIETLKLSGEMGFVGNNVEWIVCHAWSAKFGDTVDALRGFFAGEGLLSEGGNTGHDRDPVVWIDLFCVSQHNFDEPTPFQLENRNWDESVISLLREARRLVVVLSPWSQPLALSRSWCLYEIYACTSMSGEVAIAMPSAAQKDFIENIRWGGFWDMLRHVNSRETLGGRDAQAIKARMEAIGFETIDWMVYDAIDRWIIGRGLAWSNERRGNSIERMIVLGNVRAVRGEVKEAAQVFETIISLLNERRGPSDLETVSVMERLASLYFDLTRYSDALPLLQESIRRRTKWGGEDDPDTLSAVTELGICYAEMGKYAEARKHLIQCLHKLKAHGAHSIVPSKKRSELDQLIFRTQLTCAVVCDRLGFGAEALRLGNELAEWTKLVLGPERPETLSALTLLGDLYFSSERFRDASFVLSELLERRTLTLGPEHPDTINVMIKYAGAKRARGQLRSAMKTFENALEIAARTLGKEHTLSVTAARQVEHTKILLDFEEKVRDYDQQQGLVCNIS